MNSNFCLFAIPKKWKRIVWEVTSKCNMSCQHCSVNASSKINFSGFVSSKEKLVEKRMKEMLSFGIREFYISGGEPLLVKNIFEIVNFLKKKKAVVKIATNGYFLDEGVTKKFSKIGIDLLHVSLDGHLPDIHNTLRGGNYFDRTIRNLLVAERYKIPLRVGTIIWRKNENLLEEMIKFCIELRVKELRFNWLIKVGRSKQYSNIYPKRRWLSVMDEIERLREKYKDKIVISIHRDPFIKLKTNYYSCPGGENLFLLNSRGQISPCSWIAKIDPNFTTKDSLYEKTFNDLVTSKQISNFKKLMNERNKRNIKGCPFISKYQSGSYFSDDSYNL